MEKSLYRRPLPPSLVAFASPEGRRLFDEARAAGGMESFFPLIEQFHTQSEPAFCGLGSLVVALNALGVDPGRLWRGPWRWYSEELLDCCAPLERVRAQGITLDELACLARCNGAVVEVARPEADDVDALRSAIAEASASSVDPALIVSYERAALGQTGSGHFSPIGGYHRASDRALILDVARFKYPPHWVPVPLLHAATRAIDPSTGRPRGWVTLRRGERPSSLLFTARVRGERGAEGLSEALASICAAIEVAESEALEPLLRRVFAASATLPLTIERRELATEAHDAAAEALRAALHDAAIFRVIAAIAPEGHAEAATLLALALPPSIWAALPAPAQARWRTLTDPAALPEAVQVEAAHLREQLHGLCALGLAGACRCA
ncbi:MAG: phytochelatin synthase family protein [Nannocystaceae bacterium]